MSLLKNLAGLAVGAAALGAAAYVLKTVSTARSMSILWARRTRSSLRPSPPSPPTRMRLPVAEPAPAAAPEEPAAPAETAQPEEPAGS